MADTKILFEHFESVDASVFTGELLYDDDQRAALKSYVGRWSRAITEHEAILAAELNETENVYTANGFKDREHYLTAVAKQLGIGVEVVETVADILGPDEDFDGLVTALKQHNIITLKGKNRV